MAVIYRITNMANGKYYIGSAESFARREWQHKYDLRRGKHKNPKLQAAWNKYGEDMFVFEIIEEVQEDRNAFDIENTYLMKCVGQPDCYNINTDAVGMRTGIPHTEETKAKISRAQKGKRAGADHYRYGKVLSEEIRKKIGDSQRGIKKKPRVYTVDGLRRAQENMRNNAREQKPISFAAVMGKFPQDILDTYDFSNAKYTGALVRIEGVVCPKHGVFSQYAAQFRKGRGCPECGAEQRAESKRKQMKQAWATPEGRNTFLKNRHSG